MRDNVHYSPSTMISEEDLDLVKHYLTFSHENDVNDGLLDLRLVAPPQEEQVEEFYAHNQPYNEWVNHNIPWPSHPHQQQPPPHQVPTAHDHSDPELKIVYFENDLASETAEEYSTPQFVYSLADVPLDFYREKQPQQQLLLHQQQQQLLHQHHQQLQYQQQQLLLHQQQQEQQQQQQERINRDLFLAFPLLPSQPVEQFQHSIWKNAATTKPVNVRKDDRKCRNCGVTNTPLWRRDKEDNYMCNACGLYLKHNRKDRPFDRNKKSRTSNRRDGIACSNCETAETPLWRKDREGNIVCNACALYKKLNGVSRPHALKKEGIQTRNRGAKKKSICEATITSDHANNNNLLQLKFEHNNQIDCLLEP